MAEPLARSPLQPFEDAFARVRERSAGRVALAPAPARGQVDLWVGEPGGDTARLSSGALGCGLPDQPNRVVHGDGTTVMWLGPGEWLVSCDPERAPALEAQLRAALAGGWGAVADVSANRVGISVSGPLVRDVLATWCTLDLRPHRFAVDDCAQTLMGRIAVLMRRRDDDAFDLWVRPSFARHMARLMIDACEPWMT
jgi:sarcosine oxidase subunit gamma